MRILVGAALASGGAAWDADAAAAALHLLERGDIALRGILYNWTRVPGPSAQESQLAAARRGEWRDRGDRTRTRRSHGFLVVRTAVAPGLSDELHRRRCVEYGCSAANTATARTKCDACVERTTERVDFHAGWQDASIARGRAGLRACRLAALPASEARCTSACGLRASGRRVRPRSVWKLINRIFFEEQPSQGKKRQPRQTLGPKIATRPAHQSDEPPRDHGVSTRRLLCLHRLRRSTRLASSKRLARAGWTKTGRGRYGARLLRPSACRQSQKNRQCPARG